MSALWLLCCEETRGVRQDVGDKLISHFSCSEERQWAGSGGVELKMAELSHSSADETNRDPEMTNSLICFLSLFSFSRKSSGRPRQRKRYVRSIRQGTNITSFLLIINSGHPSAVLEFSSQRQGAMELVLVGEAMPVPETHGLGSSCAPFISLSTSHCLRLKHI